MAMYSLNLMKIALELAMHDHVYEDIATKFFDPSSSSPRR